jgi:lauroyl/myristoyl acyltransferase
VGECDKGSNMEFRMFCVSAVRNRQRDHIYGVKPMNANNTKIITSSPAKYFWMN